jgi:hypothetical protein
VIPRLTRTAGFELGSGMFINTVLSEGAAEFLRNIKIEKATGAVSYRRIGTRIQRPAGSDAGKGKPVTMN